MEKETPPLKRTPQASLWLPEDGTERYYLHIIGQADCQCKTCQFRESQIVLQ
jgi:hypothetical protein